MKGRADLEIVKQATFGSDGSIETDGGAVETTFLDWGVKLDVRNRESRIARPEATEFGKDDRAVRGEVEAGDQETLFVDVDDDQVTLGGDRAAGRSRWD